MDSSEMGFPVRDWFNALEPFSEKLRGRVRVMFGLSGRIGPRSFWTESARMPTDTHLKNRQALDMFSFGKFRDCQIARRTVPDSGYAEASSRDSLHSSDKCSSTSCE